MIGRDEERARGACGCLWGGGARPVASANTEAATLFAARLIKQCDCNRELGLSRGARSQMIGNRNVGRGKTLAGPLALECVGLLIRELMFQAHCFYLHARAHLTGESIAR